MYIEYRKEIRELLDGKVDMIFSDDLDGYVSGAIAQKYLGLNTVGFFNPYSLYLTKKLDVEKTIGLDITFDKQKINVDTLSNHVEKVSVNDDFSNGISCNEHIGLQTYTNKSLFSTSLMLWGALDLPLPTTKKGKMLLLLLDSTYMQYYNPNFRRHSVGYLKAYGLDGLLDVLKNTEEHEFEILKQDFAMLREVKMDKDDMTIDTELLYKDGKVDELLELLGLDRLDIPSKFQWKVVLERKRGSSWSYSLIRQQEDVFSFAMIYKNTVNYSVYKGTINRG